MTPEEIAAGTRLEQEGGRNALRRFASLSRAMKARYALDFVPAKELAHLSIDPDVKLPDDIQATIDRGEAKFKKFKRKFYRYKKQQQRIGNTSRKASAPPSIFITSVVDKEAQDRRDANLDALERQSRGKRGRPPMLVRLRVVQIIVDRLLADGVPFATSRNSRMNKLVRERLNEMAARSRDKSESRCKKIGADAVQRLLRQIKGLGK
jgi:hypothetical protein